MCSWLCWFLSLCLNVTQSICSPGRARTPARTKSGPLRSSLLSWMTSLAAVPSRWNIAALFASIPLLLPWALFNHSCYKCLCFPLGASAQPPPVWPLPFTLSPLPPGFPLCCFSPLWFLTCSVSSGHWCSHNHAGTFLPFPAPHPPTATHMSLSRARDKRKKAAKFFRSNLFLVEET